jgi:serine---pyruvate transaminase
MAEPVFHHRTPKYRKLFAAVIEDLKKVFRTRHKVFTFTGSGTLCMEASVVNFLSPGDQVIVIEAGKFGERWREIASCFAMTVISIKAEYGSYVTKEQVREALKKHPNVKAVYGTLCETSTGVLFDVAGIAQVVSKTDALFIVDAISGLLADRLEMDEWAIDVVVCGSQKGFMLPPGLAFLAVNDKAYHRVREAKSLRYYVDLAQYNAAMEKSDTPFTPALTLVLALRKVLDLVKQEGVETIWERTKRLAQKVRNDLENLNIEQFAKHPANTLTACKVPRGIDGEKLIEIMRDQKGVTMAGGQGSMKGQIFRMAHFGYITENDLKQGLSVLRETIDELRPRKSTQNVSEVRK